MSSPMPDQTLAALPGRLRAPFEMKHGLPGRAGRRDASSSVAPIALLSGLPASLPRTTHRTPSARGHSEMSSKAPSARTGSAEGRHRLFSDREAAGKAAPSLPVSACAASPPPRLFSDREAAGKAAPSLPVSACAASPPPRLNRTAEHVAQPQRQVTEALPATEVRRDGLVRVARLPPRRRGDVAPEEAECGALPASVVERPQKHVRGPRAEIVRRLARRRPGAPARPALARREGPVVVEDGLAERARAPAERRRLQLVDAVPTEPLLEREHLLEARAAPHARRAADVAVRDVPG